MKVKCIYNTGKDLRVFENKLLNKNELGKFGATEYTEYTELKIGREYLVMGMIMFESYLAYLIDDDGFICTCPCQLFEILDNKTPPNWYFRLVGKEEDIYPYIQAVWGYHELCFDKKSYENLIVEKEENAQRIYFRRKIELEKELSE